MSTPFQGRSTAVLLALGASLAVVATAGACGTVPDVERRGAPVVYGEDGRQDLYEATDPAFADLLARSTVALVDPLYIDLSDPDHVVPDTITLGEYKDLCPGERFADQPAMASCSGTLIDDDLVLTAAHCVDETVCAEWAFVFGFMMTAPGELGPMTSADVYFCAEILVREYTTAVTAASWHDFAVVRLDRPVEGDRAPAPVLMDPAQVAPLQGLTALGFGNGIPGKIHAGGAVRLADVSWGYFTGSTDTFSGNSGSGTYTDDHLLAGVFVRGADDDYAPGTGGCSVVNTVADSAGTQEYDYAYKAVDALCAAGWPSARLCDGWEPRPDPGAGRDGAGGCHQAGAGADGWLPLFLALAVALGLAVRPLTPRRSKRRLHARRRSAR